jgi:predicted PurR-regulated permease PerM
VVDPSGKEEKDILGWWTRERLSSLALFLLTVLGLVLCFLLLQPFISALTWALALSIVALPIHRRIEKRINRHVAATLSLLLVAGVIVAPAYFVIQSVSQEVATGVDQVRNQLTGENWEMLKVKNPWVQRAFHWIENQFDLRQTAERLATAFSSTAVIAVRGSVQSAIELLVMFFFLFFFFRDRKAGLAGLRTYLPLSDSEADTLFRRVEDAVYATINGTIVVGLVQGVLGGLMFWWLGLPAPFLWGTVMALLSFVPVLGAFVVWIPAAIVLALQGHWVKALILSLWGAIVIGLIDNILYPILVGRRIALHTVPVFIALVGGVVLFGASGLILGPLIVAVTLALMDVWQGRMGKASKAELVIKS